MALELLDLVVVSALPSSMLNIEVVAIQIKDINSLNTTRTKALCRSKGNT